MIQAAGLVQRFGMQVALGPIDLELKTGERLAVLGDNGAGKTTLLRILATLARPAAGHLTLCGLDATKQRRRVRPRLGYLGHQPGLAPMLTALENLCFFARLHGLGTDRASEALSWVELDEASRLRAGELSRGMQQRVALARALMHEPELLILDEPDASLDASGRALLERLLAGQTLVLATHDWDLARRLCGHSLLLHQGRPAGDPLRVASCAS
jgi:heme exporter protein A